LQKKIFNNGKDGQGTHCTKMGADSLAKNTPNTPELYAQFVVGIRF
jgi:hypothetical protein